MNGVVRREPEWRVNTARDHFEVDEEAVREGRKVYLMLNKPRGLVTTASDEKGRRTVFECLKGKNLPLLMPVGRLDQASEGLLLFSNDTAWAARLTDPASHIEKIYHVQVNCIGDEALACKMEQGVRSQGELLRATRVSVLRRGEKNSWLEIVLDEGRNRHIRRLLAALGIELMRLVRVQVGTLKLGNLAKGEIRLLAKDEVAALGTLSQTS